MQPFPKITQPSQAVRNVHYRARHANGTHPDGQPIKPELAPILQYHGTVKLHGTNAAVVLEPGKDPIYQSRNRELTPIDDNMGFAAAMAEGDKAAVLRLFYEDVVLEYGLEHGKQLVVYGEWCGEGIQQGVAISRLPKMFVIFALRHQEEWLDIRRMPEPEPGARIYGINAFGGFAIDIDFNDFATAQNQMVTLTDNIEQLCPVGLAFGVEGTGEGVVWRCTTPGWQSSAFWFKVKGQKHSEHNCRVVQMVDLERGTKAKAFVEGVVTEARLAKGFDYLKEMGLPLDRTSTRDYLKWVFEDVCTEEFDTMVELGLVKKDIGKGLSNAARTYFFERV